MVVSDFLQEVASSFATLIQRGLLLVESSIYDAQSFGNAAVVLAGRHFRIRLIRDRSQIVAEMASADRPEEWSSLQRVLNAVLDSGAPPEGILTTDEAARMVDSYYAEIEDCCSPAKVGTTRAKLAELERKAIKVFVERAKRGRN